MLKRNSALHKGHRERLLRRFMDGGELTDVQALEALLFYCLPRVETNEISHRLIEKFGNFRGLSKAGTDELAALTGMGRTSAKKLRRLLDLTIEYRALMDERFKQQDWRYYTVCTYLEEVIAERFIRRDVRCVFIIFKRGMRAKTYNIYEIDELIISMLMQQKQDGDVTMLAFHESSNEYLPNSDELTRLMKNAGIDLYSIIERSGRIRIELV